MPTTPALETPAAPDWTRRYLAVLGVETEPPSLSALARLMSAHLGAIHFENTTALLRRQAHPDGPVPPPDPDALLANWEARRGGGVCFEIAPMFARLLTALGYRVTLVIGQISFPGGHQALIVDLGPDRYLVDVGCGSPIFQPIPLSGETEVHHAALSYRFRASHEGDEENTWLQERRLDGVWTPFCRYGLLPPAPDVREAAYQRHHTPGQSWVLDKPRIIRCTPDAVLFALGNELTRFTPTGKHTDPIPDPLAYQQLASSLFDLPALPIAEAFQIHRSLMDRLAAPETMGN